MIYLEENKNQLTYGCLQNWNSNSAFVFGNRSLAFLLPQLLSALRCCELWCTRLSTTCLWHVDMWISKQPYYYFKLVHHLSLTCPVVRIKGTNITSWSPDSVKYDIKSQWLGERGGAYTILDPILEAGRHNLQSFLAVNLTQNNFLRAHILSFLWHSRQKCRI